MHERVGAALATSKADYTVHHHRDFANPIRSPYDFAAALGYPISRITKSLFVRSVNPSQGFALVVCPVDRKVDFKVVASVLGWKRTEVASRDELEAQLGYPPTGVSPLGLPDSVLVLIDSSLANHPTILIGAGESGVEVEISATALAQLTHAQVVALA